MSGEEKILKRVQLEELRDILSGADTNKKLIPFVVQKDQQDIAEVVHLGFFDLAMNLISELSAPTVARVCDLPDHIKQSIIDSRPSEEEVRTGKWADGRDPLP